MRKWHSALPLLICKTRDSIPISPRKLPYGHIVYLTCTQKKEACPEVEIRKRLIGELNMEALSNYIRKKQVSTFSKKIIPG